MLESGEFATIAELAEREGIAPSCMTRALRLTLLALDIVEAILDGKQGAEVTLRRVLVRFPIAWAQQNRSFGRAKLSPLATIERNAMACSPWKSAGPSGAA